MHLFARLARLAIVTRHARPPEVRFALRAWLLAPFVEASLATLDVHRTLRWCSHLPRLGARRAALPIDVAGRWVDRAYAVHLLRGQCLPRALVQHALLRADGVASRLVVGVRRSGGGLDAHAWVDEGTGPAAYDGFAPILIADERGIVDVGAAP